MRVLLTGHEGFIGQNLKSHLESHGYEIYGADWADAGRRQPLEDLRQPGVFDRHFWEAEPDMVVHLAAQVGRLFGEDDLIRTVQSNAQMTTLVAASCGKHGVPLTYASTSEVYGDQQHALCDEVLGPFALPHNLYGLSKRWGEEVCQLYAPRDLRIMRFSMPYGAGVVPGRGRAALPNIIWQANTGQSIPVHKGSERSWCWIGDTVEGVRLVLEDKSPATPKTFNVGRDDNALTMLDLAQQICDKIGASRDLIDEVDPPGKQTVVKRLSTSRLRSLGWRPKVELDEGIEKVYEWVKLFDDRGKKAA